MGKGLISLTNRPIRSEVFSVLTLHVLWHHPVVEQPVVLHRALHRLHQQVVGGGAGSVGFAFGLSAVGQAGQQEEEVVDIPQELLTLAGELEGRFVFEDAGGETQESGEPVVLDRPVLLVQDLTAGGEKNRGRDGLVFNSLTEQHVLQFTRKRFWKRKGPSDLLMQSARCRARASRSSRVVCIEPASDREGETFCEFKQTNTSNSSMKHHNNATNCSGHWIYHRSMWSSGLRCVRVPPGWRL